jgi:hypothetical protein
VQVELADRRVLELRAAIPVRIQGAPLEMGALDLDPLVRPLPQLRTCGPPCGFGCRVPVLPDLRRQVRARRDLVLALLLQCRFSRSRDR